MLQVWLSVSRSSCLSRRPSIQSPADYLFWLELLRFKIQWILMLSCYMAVNWCLPNFEHAKDCVVRGWGEGSEFRAETPKPWRGGRVLIRVTQHTESSAKTNQLQLNEISYLSKARGAPKMMMFVAPDYAICIISPFPLRASSSTSKTTYNMVSYWTTTPQRVETTCLQLHSSFFSLFSFALSAAPSLPPAPPCLPRYT